MTNIQVLQRLAKQMSQELSQSKEVLAVWFYGAAQRKRTWQRSDVDLLVLIERGLDATETRSLRDGVVVHLHWIGREAFERKIQADEDRILHGRVGMGELLFDRDGTWSAFTETMRELSPDHRFYQMVPHLENLLGWARDLHKRMALRDERPRRAAARQWQVDYHTASVLLLEKGWYPHNEATVQALNARIFVPNMAHPKEIEAFVAECIERYVLPQWQGWFQDETFDAGILTERYKVAPSALMLAFAAEQGWLEQVENEGRIVTHIKEMGYRLT